MPSERTEPLTDSRQWIDRLVIPTITIVLMIAVVGLLVIYGAESP